MKEKGGTCYRCIFAEQPWRCLQLGPWRREPFTPTPSNTVVVVPPRHLPLITAPG